MSSIHYTFPLETWPAMHQTVVADGKPHQGFECTLAAQSDIIPARLWQHSSGTFDLAAAAASSLATSLSEIYIGEIADDYPDRDTYDTTTAYPSAGKAVPVKRCEIGRKYYINTATDMSNYTVGELLIPAADGDLARPGDTSPGALEYNAHGFIFKYAVSTTQIVVEYAGLVAIDAT